MKHTITKLFLLLLLATAGTAKAQQWTQIQTGLNEEYLRDICCIDKDQVLVCGSHGLIAKSTDGGLHWEQKDTPTNSRLHLLKFVNDQVGFALGSSVLLKTVDRGETWIKMESVNDITFNGISNLFLVDADTLYLSDSQNVIWKSSDGGETFSQMMIDPSELARFEKMEMYFEDNMGYLVGHETPWMYSGDHVVGFKTTDFGQTWEPIMFGFQYLECIQTIHFTDKNNARVFGCFDDGTYWYNTLETSDGFESYSLLFPDDYDCWYFGEIISWENTRALVFTSENDGCMLFNWDAWKPDYHSSGVMFTSDNGDTWTTMSNGIDIQRYLLSIDGIGSTYYIAADGGIVYKIDLSDDALDEKETYVKVFPNPTADKVSVKMATAIEPSDPVHIELIGADGRIAMQKTAHGNEVALDLGKLSPGIYVLSVKGNSIIHRQTIIKTE